ncbi:MAG TPA: hypothetical protein V6D04_02195 [Candidatus Obscuribacterales bacterium]
MIFETDFDQQEALKYRPGQRVELKHQPGLVDVIVSYDPMMVPPIELASDPMPRYPEELHLLPMPALHHNWLSFQSQTQYPACSLRDREASLKVNRATPGKANRSAKSTAFGQRSKTKVFS